MCVYTRMYDFIKIFYLKMDQMKWKYDEDTLENENDLNTIPWLKSFRNHRTVNNQ